MWCKRFIGWIEKDWSEKSYPCGIRTFKRCSPAPELCGEGIMRIAYGLQMPPAQFYKLIPTPKRLPKKGEYKGVKKKAALKKRP
jgi:hypothetical protein